MSDCSTALSNSICGGNGQCVNDLCVCDSDWVTTSDWVQTTSDCPTNLIGIRILWAINALLILVVYVRSADVILARTRVFFEQRKNQKDYTLWSNRGLLAVYLLFLGCMPFQLAMAVLKIVLPDTHIGFDIAPSVLFFVTRFFFYLAVACYQPALMSTILRGTRGTEMIVQVYAYCLLSLQVMTILAGGLSLVGLFIDLSFDNEIIILRTYVFCHGSSLVLNALLAFVTREKVKKVLLHSASLAQNPGAKNNKMVKLNEKIGNVQRTVIIQGSIQGIFLFAVFAIPVLWNKHDWFLPISWLVMPLLGVKIAFAVNTDTYQNKSLIERFRKKKGKKSSTAEGNNTDGKPGTTGNEPMVNKSQVGSNYKTSNLGPNFHNVGPLTAISSATPEMETPASPPLNLLQPIDDARPLISSARVENDSQPLLS